MQEVRDAPGAPAGRRARPLADARFRWFLAGRGVDQVGNAVQPIALGFAMLAVFGDVAALGIVVGANSVGQVLLVLAGGVVADRLPRSVVLVASNVVAAVAQAGIVAMVLADVPTLWLYALLAFVTGAAAAFDGPATTALIPELVAAPDLTAANGNLSVIRRIASIGGAPLAGLLIALVGPGWTLAIDALSFLVAAFCFSRLTGLPRPEPTGATPLQDLRDGWAEFRRRRWVVAIVVAFAFINAAITGGFFVVGLAIAERTIGADGWGLVLGAFGVGSLVVSLAAGRVTVARPLLVGMTGAAVASITMFALAAEAGVLVLMLCGAISGGAMTQFGIGWDTALQQHIPQDRLARVASIDTLGSFAAIPIGAFIAGPTAEVFGETTVAATSGVIILVCAAATLLVREVRHLNSPTT